ncbi:Killer toxin subunits alpha beta [Fusarium albosuccineum]|uniref:Killer toxin subunits alpha beta n=1 Tax=Fusarium albosuccineum TaxID=1237068 RepID=A0A8H4PFS3_9HYPO|nr:Killer toxin subunits alpha beta [Fusarium albosuccineum]
MKRAVENFTSKHSPNLEIRISFYPSPQMISRSDGRARSDSSKATNCRLSPELKTQGGSQYHICPLSCKKNKTRWPVMGTLAIVFADAAAVPALGDIGVKVKGQKKAFRDAADSRRGLKPDSLKLFYGEFRHNDKLARDILKREC